MTSAHLKAVAPVLTASLIATAAPAHDYRAGSLAVGQPWARETAPGQAAGGGFLTITNNGAREDRLVSASSPVASQTQIHSMTMDRGVMRMRPVAGGLAIPAHGTVSLQPGGLHIMFIGLKHPLRRGERVPATLHFQRAGNVAIEFQVSAIDAPPPAGGHAPMNMPGM